MSIGFFKKRRIIRIAKASSAICLAVAIGFAAAALVFRSGKPADSNSPVSAGKPEPAADTTDLASLDPIQLAAYSQNIAFGKIRRDPKDVDAAIQNLSEEKIDALCKAFKKTPYGPDIRGFAITLSKIGTEKALRTLGTFYKRENLPDSFLDQGVSRYLGDTHSPIAEEILLDAYDSLKQTEIRKVVLIGLMRFCDSKAVTSMLLQRIPNIEDASECKIAMGCLAASGDKDGFELIKQTALGNGNRPKPIRLCAAGALQYSGNAGGVDALRQIMMACLGDVEMCKQCAHSLQGLLGSNVSEEAAQALCDIALEKDVSVETRRACMLALAEVDNKHTSEALGKLSREMENADMRRWAEEICRKRGRGQ